MRPHFFLKLNNYRYEDLSANSGFGIARCLNFLAKSAYCPFQMPGHRDDTLLKRLKAKYGGNFVSQVEPCVDNGFKPLFTFQVHTLFHRFLLTRPQIHIPGNHIITERNLKHAFAIYIYAVVHVSPQPVSAGSHPLIVRVFSLSAAVKHDEYGWVEANEPKTPRRSQLVKNTPLEKLVTDEVVQQVRSARRKGTLTFLQEAKFFAVKVCLFDSHEDDEDDPHENLDDCIQLLACLGTEGKPASDPQNVFRPQVHLPATHASSHTPRAEARFTKCLR